MAEVSVSSLKVELPSCSVNVEVVPDSFTVKRYIQHKISTVSSQEYDLEVFSVIDLGEILHVYDAWMRAFPTVTPYYAVKAFSDSIVLKIMAQLGVNFDCASLNEIKSVLELGVSSDRIIFANPCKMISHLKYAAKNGINLMTFDSLSELHKTKKYFPYAHLVVRVAVENDDAGTPMGEKFGCSLSEAKDLLNEACTMGLDVVGASFHAGGGCQSGSGFCTAIETCSKVFEHAASIGYHFTLLDIGGGYPSAGNMEVFLEQADTIKQSLHKHFNRERLPDLKVIAEPGRFFSATLVSEAVSVINVKTFQDGGCPRRSYHISDGVYGLLSSVRGDPCVEYLPKLLEDKDGCPTIKSAVWGATLGAYDKICEEINLPELKIGDWMYFQNIGAYAHVARTNFNGFDYPQDYYYIRQNDKMKVLQSAGDGKATIVDKDARVYS